MGLAKEAGVYLRLNDDRRSEERIIIQIAKRFLVIPVERILFKHLK